MGRPPGIGSTAWERFRALVLATYGNTCYLCSHGGARTVDHVESFTEHPELAFSLANCRPAHGTRNRCLTCGQCCNQVKGGYSASRARRLIAERARAPVPPRAPVSPASPDAGRPW